MEDWKKNLVRFRKELEPSKDAVHIMIPNHFIFRDHDVFNFDKRLDFFNWNIFNKPVVIDFSECKTANYQALSLIVPYCWKLKSQGCRISFKTNGVGASEIWKYLGAGGLFHVSTNKNSQFRHNDYKPLLAIRNTKDFKNALSKVEEFTKGFDVEYEKTLRYVLSELLYNTMEHGASYFSYKGKRLVTPSIIQFTWYKRINEIHFLIADTGTGIKNHLSQTYPSIENDVEAIRLAIKPQISGTFSASNPYQAKNNAGVGLYISTNIIKKLRADMHIISGNGLIHISPRDITDTVMESKWPGTMILVSIKLNNNIDFEYHSMMQEFRNSAMAELKKSSIAEKEDTYYLSIENYFGKYAEDKESAIKIRDSKLLPNLKLNKKITVDFRYVESAPHSFLSALFATPVKRLGLKSYKKINILNASPEIRETIDYIFDENTES